MGLQKENYTKKQIEVIADIAITKTTGLDYIDFLEYVRISNEYVNNKKDIKNKYQYLLSTLENDYAGLLF